MVKTINRKNKAKTPKKRKKSRFSEALHALLLTGIIIAVSALISCAVIMVHSGIKDKDDDSQENFLTNIDDENSSVNIAIIPDEKPITVTVEQPVIKETQPASSSVLTENNTYTSNNNSDTSASASAASSTSPTVSINTSVNPAISSTIKPPVKKVEDAGTLVFVIDDAGNNLRELEPFLRVPGPLTIAVLPGLPYSAEAAKRIRAAGKEVILHQPMEAIGAQNPGPGAVYSYMNAAEIKEVLARNVAEVGPVKGINNHQGSKITMDKEAMQTILEFCAENGLYFLDSRTTADSVAPEIARRIGLKITERNVFIDNEQNKESMLRYINTGLARSQRNGTAVMIGHTWSPDLAPLLTEQFPIFIQQGYKIKTAFDIIQ